MSNSPVPQSGRTKREATTFLGTLAMMLGITLTVLAGVMFIAMRAPVRTSTAQPTTGPVVRIRSEVTVPPPGPSQGLMLLTKAGLIVTGILMLLRKPAALWAAVATLAASMAYSGMQIHRSRQPDGSTTDLTWSIIWAAVAAAFYIVLIVYLRLPKTRQEFEGA